MIPIPIPHLESRITKLKMESTCDFIEAVGILIKLQKHHKELLMHGFRTGDEFRYTIKYARMYWNWIDQALEKFSSDYSRKVVPIVESFFDERFQKTTPNPKIDS